MTDLIKNEAEFLRNCATDIETGEPLEDEQLCNLYVIDAHRIADLIEDLEERNKELTLQLLATSGQAADALDKLTKAEKELNISRMANVVMDNTVEELEAKLTKAEEERDEYKAAAAIWQEDFIQENQRLYVATVKLAIVVEALRFYAPQTVGGITFVGGDDAGKRAAAMLAELEGK
jgi:hypothetical protein